jgi:hypothetical protein
MKLVVVSSAVAFVLAIPAAAWAQSAPGGASGGSCPPGSWFCTPPADAEPAPPPAGKTVQGLQPLPDPDEEPAPSPARRQPTVVYEPAPSQPPVVVYQPPPPVTVVRPEDPPPYEYAPPPHKPISPPREWGLNLHLEGAAIGSGVNHNASMGGLGGGLRYKPTRYFGLETDLDFVGGRGYAGDQRTEQALSFNGLLFLNPRDRAQVYLLAGFGWSWAHSTNDPSDPTQGNFSNSYSYFGGQAGVGLELRLTRVLAFNLDFRGFVRSRTDVQPGGKAEFTDATTGQTTNTSGGGLLTGGMTLYF